MSESAAKRLAADPSVAYVEQNQTVSLLATQSNATWGMDRIDQRARPLSTTYTYPRTASNVTAYIIDTGIRFAHTDFGGRATSGYDAVDGGAADDCNGHGTHVAGTVGGTTWGVAKQVSLVGVRVLNCSGSGTNAGVIAGVNWVTQNARKPAVANMSLGGGASTALDNAVANSISSGVTLRPGGRQLVGQRVQLVARPGRLGDHGRRHHQHGRPRVVLELRHLPGHLRARLVDQVGLVHQQLRHQHDQRHVDGVPARGRRGRVGALREPVLHPGAGPRQPGQQRHRQRGDQPRNRLPEPPALRRPITNPRRYGQQRSPVVTHGASSSVRAADRPPG